MDNQYSAETADELSQLSDELLVSKIVETNNPALFELIYDRFSKKVFNKCLSFTKVQEEAEDMTHDIFLKIYLKLGSFNHKAKFSTWVYAVTYNFCVDHQNSKAKRIVQLDEYKSENESSYSMDGVSDEELFQVKIEQLKILLEEIHPEEKALLLMKYQDGFAVSDIMGSTGLSESAVKMRLKRSKEKLLKMYESKYLNHGDR